MNQSQAIIESLMESRMVDTIVPRLRGDDFTIPVMFDPRAGELLAFTKRTRVGESRMLVGKKHLVVWDADLAIHRQVFRSSEVKGKDKWIMDVGRNELGLRMKFNTMENLIREIDPEQAQVLQAIFDEHPPRTTDIPVLDNDHMDSVLRSAVLKKTLASAEFLSIGAGADNPRRLIYFTKGWNPIEIVWDRKTRTYGTEQPKVA